MQIGGVLHARAMVREMPPASDSPYISFHEPAKKGTPKDRDAFFMQ